MRRPQRTAQMRPVLRAAMVSQVLASVAAIMARLTMGLFREGCEDEFDHDLLAMPHPGS